MWPFSDGFEAYEVTEDDVRTIRQRAGEHTHGSALLKIRPFVGAKGFGGGEPVRFARAFHRTDRGEMPTYAHEVWFHKRRLAFHVSTPDPESVRDTVDTLYPSSTVTRVDSDDAFPRVEPGEYVAAARLPLKKDSAYPIRYPGSRQPYDADPMEALLPKATNSRGERVLIQTVFRPVDGGWFNRGRLGGSVSAMADSRKKGHVVGTLNPRVVQSPADKDAAKDMHKQRGRPAFAVTVRVVAIATTAEGACDRVGAVADTFDEFDHDATEQGFDVIALESSDARNELERAAMRLPVQKNRIYRWVMGRSNVLTDRELGVVAHIPGAEVEVSEIDREHTEVGSGVPPGAPLHFGPEAEAAEES